MCQSKAHLHLQTSKLNATRLPHPILPSKPKIVVLGGGLLGNDKWRCVVDSARHNVEQQNDVAEPVVDFIII
jgi:hypothetical protein